MGYQIIGDSCMDLTPAMRADRQHFRTIPLSIEVGGRIVIDDDTFCQETFLELVEKSPECPKSACPSPEAFLSAYEEGPEDLYVVTITEKLSGSYNAARLAKQMYEEKHGADHKNIAVIGSDSGTAGETCLALLIEDLCKRGEAFSHIRDKALAHVKKMQTFFVLEDLSALRKNGRLSGTAAFFATALNIKPVLYAKDGEIQKYDQTRGMDRALKRMCAAAVQHAEAAGTLSAGTLPSDRIRSACSGVKSRAVITYCSCPERAKLVRDILSGLAHFEEIVMAPTRGISTVYASNGGIVVAI